MNPNKPYAIFHLKTARKKNEWPFTIAKNLYFKSSAMSTTLSLFSTADLPVLYRVFSVDCIAALSSLPALC